MDPVNVLRQIALHLERSGEPSYRVRAFRNAAAVVADLPDGELARRVEAGTLTELAGIGKTTAGVVAEAVQGREPAYLTDLESRGAPGIPDGGPLHAALRGDCHTHSDWSDGGSSIEEMAEAARALGHEYLVLTDHSPRLTVARGLSAERLRRQLDVVAECSERLAPLRILTGIEVDILDDGSLDQDPDLLEQLDVVVASVHSKLRMSAAEMTERMLTAVANPRVNILGHCTGRLVAGRGRPESQFDAKAVFAACREFDVAVEINSRPERLDPPRRLLRLAQEEGCRFAIDTDAHAPGQLSWLPFGCVRASECGVTPDRIVNTWTADELTSWAALR
ncbi:MULTISPECIES: PHP domain-containing protein [Prauserella salsuginis group]|uniref:PHP domain-containing protein n=2 Tax=Prauserella salsuginis group TaxID=2893672 RepID=A0ABW6G501_9PSEU|nr:MULTISPECIES: PHP domain-containing protein [Prauserella salsuginis group]MBB3665841.1 putative hydrolase [Prauserella sediminis]MCR3718825.1 putative hydrolase [Prauserella flava]MCR3733395.1 putative hydrolase [Prauserella salsuginis]